MRRWRMSAVRPIPANAGPSLQPMPPLFGEHRAQAWGRILFLLSGSKPFVADFASFSVRSPLAQRELCCPPHGEASIGASDPC